MTSRVPSTVSMEQPTTSIPSATPAPSVIQTGTTAAPVPPPTAEAATDPTEVSILRIAKERKTLLEERATHKDALSRGERAGKAEAAFKAGDYLAGLEAMGLDPDDFYVKATDQINSRTRKQQDPREIAREEAQKLLQAERVASETNASQRVVTDYVNSVRDVMFSDYDSYPGVARALVSEQIEPSFFHAVAIALKETGKPHGPKDVLTLINGQFAPKKAAPAAATPPLALVNDSPTVVVADDSKLSFAEALAKAKAKHFKQ